MAITVVGSTIALTPAGGATANVGNVTTKTNTFHITNASATVYAYVGVFPTYAEAIAMNHPSAGVAGAGTIITPGGHDTITGNFGTQQLADQTNVYVAAITAAGSTSVFFTPVAPGSD